MTIEFYFYGNWHRLKVGVAGLLQISEAPEQCFRKYFLNEEIGRCYSVSTWRNDIHFERG
jgi:hypothetical protein